MNRGDTTGRSGRWPRRRRVLDRHDPARWDPERTSQDLPSLGATVALTLLGLAVLSGLAAWQPVLGFGLYGLLFAVSVGVDVTGNRVTTRVDGVAGIVTWALMRPFYTIGVVLWGLVEAIVELVG